MSAGEAGGKVILVIATFVLIYAVSIWVDSRDILIVNSPVNFMPNPAYFEPGR